MSHKNRFNSINNSEESLEFIQSTDMSGRSPRNTKLVYNRRQEREIPELERNNRCSTKQLSRTFAKVERARFLDKCIVNNVIIPSLRNKKIDFDLNLIQQERVLIPQIKQIVAEYKDFMRLTWFKLTTREKDYIWTWRRKEKKRFITKFNWLLEKQRRHEINFKKAPNWINNKNIRKNRTNKNRKDKGRYIMRNKRKQSQTNDQNIQETIVNKSDIELDKNDLKLLQHGLGFVPTPNWNQAMERSEWENLFQHIRRTEWNDIYENSEENNSQNSIISKKLKVPKFSRPKKYLLKEETSTYVELVTNKLRNIEEKVNENYKKKNNLNFELRKSLHKLINLVKLKKIVICRSDKDGKMIICNNEDYTSIIEKELRKYEPIKERKNMEKFLKNTKERAEIMVLDICRNKDITEDLLYNTTGFKKNVNGEIKRITGTAAKFFSNLETGYVYPLFKTHKLAKAEIITTGIQHIPTRLVQATGDTYLSRITAFIEEIIKPVSQEYCTKIVNEYCRDSKHYITDLMKWKKKCK